MDIDAILLQADKLSPTPQILPKLQAVLRELNADIGEISALVKFDAALTAQIVRLGNSAFFGMSKPSKSVDEAISRLGMREIYNLVGLIVARQIFGEELRYYGLKSTQLWENSVLSAALMETFAERTGHNVEVAYTAGLVRDIGKVLINRVLQEKEVEYDGSAVVGLEEERRLLGFDFAEIGAALLKKWNFHEEIFAAVRFQVSPLESPETNPFACLLYLTNLAMTNDICASGEAVEDSEVNASLLKAVGLNEDLIAECFDQARGKFARISSFIKAA